MNIGRYKKWIILGLISIVLVIIIIFSALTSQVVMTSENNPAKTTFSYSLLDQSNNKSNTSTNTESSSKKFVSSGNYEALIQQKDNSYFSVVHTPGFFQTTTVSGVLQKERERTFVGNNPSDCMALVNTTLLSVGCGQKAEVTIHVPAKGNIPTYTLANKRTPFGYNEGFVKTSQGTLALFKTPFNSENGPQQTIYEINNGLNFEKGVILTDLDPEQTYSITPYLQGFVVYNTNFTKILYYFSTQSKPQDLSFNTDLGKYPSPVSFDVKKDTILTAYTNNTGSDEDSSAKDIKTKVNIREATKSKSYLLDGAFSEVHLCGTQKICLINNKEMVVYDISIKTPDILYTISNVQTIKNTSDNLLVVTDFGVLNFNADKRSGYFEYSFGSYQFNGVVVDGNNYILRLTNNQNDKVALYINQDQENTNSIDKKITELVKDKNIKSISVYGKTIYIIPDTPIIFNTSLNSFTNDPVKQKTINEEIRKIIQDININTSEYTIINSSQ